ncbi:5188_t:CDS:1 [Scutellospora calospora]|uniref:5188_t:CDS:1 n=1 Tax=Scutellospora calospora TaxID=85575 RepID=A0ACA9NTV7_9GLOM|nr:5188_t:CDS:1 [Scutellospora calospora]
MAEKLEKSSSANSKKEIQHKATKTDTDRIFRQLLLLIFYVGTVTSGSLSRIINPFHESYFSQKSNFLNQWFVKFGWFWTSTIFFIYFWNVIYRNNLVQITKPFFRWTAATLYWYIVTHHWFLDQIYLLTGGKCTLEGSEIESYNFHECEKEIGANWSGGHDISGHCLLLIHSSLFLWEELFSENVKRAKQYNIYTYSLTYFLMLLWWYMLLMTSVYFHNFSELLSGTFFGVLYWIVVYMYILPSRARDWLPCNNKDLEEEVIS